MYIVALREVLKVCEIYSPLGLLRCLKDLNNSKTCFSIIQLRNDKIKKFSKVAHDFKSQFAKLPFFSVKMLLYDNNRPNHVYYKTDFTRTKFMICDLGFRRTSRKSKSGPTIINSKPLPFKEAPKICANNIKTLSDKKVKDIKSTFSYMGERDVVFYRTILK